jgi:hypothetical protein
MKTGPFCSHHNELVGKKCLLNDVWMATTTADISRYRGFGGEDKKGDDLDCWSPNRPHPLLPPMAASRSSHPSVRDRRG